MINFIKDAVTAVSGIKTFLFNTDYRNNFDLQNVEFPCCVLTPIMRTNYDLNNIIRESAELQLSVVDLAPYEYTGDDLYAINKRCSDLALQVIANLQVKSKLDKELTFEFILPSGDELISGVMCNLQCTMKQGSCIGAPSYVEVIVQPIKKKSITSNGKHIITPNSGFNAMKEVEVDVNVGQLTTEEKSVTVTSNGEVEILPTTADAMTKVTANVQVPPPSLEEKQVIITKAKTTEIITPDAEYGLSRVEVQTDIPLESKQITITENGTTTIEASEGFEGIESVEVTTDVNTLQGLDFPFYDGAFFNEFLKEKIRKIANAYDRILTFYKGGGNWNNVGGAVVSVTGSLFFPYVKTDTPITTIRSFASFSYDLVGIDNRYDFSQCEDVEGAFRYAVGLIEAKCNFDASKAKNWARIFESCYSLRFLPDHIDSANGEDFSSAFMNCRNLPRLSINTNKAVNLSNAFSYISSCKELYLTSIENAINMTSMFSGSAMFIVVHFEKWKQTNISISESSSLSPESIHYIIQNAVDLADGATARTLTLHATAKTNWQNSEYYQQDLAVLSTKGITIA